MSAEENLHLIAGHDDYTSNELMTFCMTLVHHSQWKARRKFVCGSTIDIPYRDLISHKFNVNDDIIDIDKMTLRTEFNALDRQIDNTFDLSSTFTNEYSNSVIRIYTNDEHTSYDVHTGYVRLIREKENTELLLSDIINFADDHAIHGPALLNNNKTDFLNTKYSLRNATEDATESERFSITSLDDVFAVHSPYWPVEATEWITRRRTQNFPSKPVIKQIVRYGCDFVQASHKLSMPYSKEWRFSFSRAEILIANSWTVSQRIVYSTLWVLNKRIASSNLCTYYFKTLMFWACEEKPTQFWHKGLLVQSVCELLIEMIKWVELKFCANYFISGNNMMDHLIHTDLSSEIEALWKNSRSYQLISEIVDASWHCELITGNLTYYIDSPAWINRSFVIYWRVNNEYDNYKDLFCTNFVTNLQNALYIELSDIYRGLRSHQKSINCIFVSDKFDYFVKSESHQLVAVNLCESHERFLLNTCSNGFTKVMMEHFMMCHTEVIDSHEQDHNNGEFSTNRISVRQNIFNGRKDQKYLLYSRSVENHEHKLDDYYMRENIIEDRNVNIAVSYVNEVNTHVNTDVTFHKQWPGMSPTVNISWFIAKAYLANLYYTSECDVNLTLKTCDEIIDVYMQSRMNHQFAEKTFPVVLSTHLSSIYDKEIQQLLGFHSLCSCVLNKSSSRSVYLAVCPVQFAHYLKLCTAMDNELTGGDCKTTSEYIDHYNKHFCACDCDSKVNSGIRAITKAIQIHYRRLGLTHIQ